MVKLTIDLIARGTSGYTKKKRSETMEQYLKRLTHLYLEDKSLEDLGDDLGLCRNLSVLYLYDNKVATVPDLSQNHCLSHLYLQNNQISRMENLAPLKRLTKLYLGGNMITVVEGLEKLDRLEEFHCENQRLPLGEKLLFDPRSLRALSSTIQVLNVSGNNLDSLRIFEQFHTLKQMIATDNNMGSMNEMAHLLQCWRGLERLDLTGNPICLKAKYRDRLVVLSNSLEMLDSKDITATSRLFLQKWKNSKDAQKKRRDDDTVSYAGPSGDYVGRHAPTEKSKISSYMMPGLPRRQFDEVLARSAVSFSAPPGGKAAHASDNVDAVTMAAQGGGGSTLHQRTPSSSHALNEKTVLEQHQMRVARRTASFADKPPYPSSVNIL